MKYIILALSIFTICSCSEQYPDNFTEDLPFGFEYGMNESRACSIIDSLSDAGVIKTSALDSTCFYYPFSSYGFETELEASLFFYNDSLYKIDIRDERSSLEEKNKRRYKRAMQFFESQEINLASYQREIDEYANDYEYDYIKHPYEIALYTQYRLIMIFCNKQIQEMINEEEEQAISSLKENGHEFCKSIMDISSGIYKATITDAGFLVIGVRPIDEPNFDYLAKSYFEQATNNGLQIKGCLVVDIGNSTWQNGAVTGKRIGEHYK